MSALPAAPRIVIDLNIEALRSTPIDEIFRSALEGNGNEDILGRRLLERAQHIRIGLYQQDLSIVLVASGAFDNLLNEAVREMTQERPTTLERGGFTAYLISERMIAVTTAPDTIVLTYPQHLDEVLATASGRAPAVPLPVEMRALQERAAFEGAPLSMLFAARRGPGAESPLATLVREAGFAGVAGRIGGERLRVIGSARVALPSRASQLGAEIENMARSTSDAELASPSLAAAIRNANVRVDDRSVEIELDIGYSDLEPFMEIVLSLSGR